MICPIFYLTKFVPSLAAALLVLAAGPLCANIASQPMHVQMDVTKKCVKILKKIKDKRSADAAAAKLGELLKLYDVSTAMGEQGTAEPEPAKRERKVPKNVQEKQKLDLGFELKRIRANENCRSEKLDALLGKLPPSTTPPDNNSNSAS